jgi:hypothetical protein
MTFARAAYGRIARHIRHRVEIHCKKYRFKPQARGGERRFYPRVTRADNGDLAGAEHETVFIFRFYHFFTILFVLHILL